QRGKNDAAASKTEENGRPTPHEDHAEKFKEDHQGPRPVLLVSREYSQCSMLRLLSTKNQSLTMRQNSTSTRTMAQNASPFVGCGTSVCKHTNRSAWLDKHMMT